MRVSPRAKGRALYEKRDRRYAVSVEQSTASVPDDNRYHVIDDGEIVLSTAVLDYALAEYDERRERHRIASGHPDPAELLRREAGERAARALKGDSISRQQRKSSRGGPGGKGGV